MSLSITGLPPAATTTALKPEAQRDRSEQSASGDTVAVASPATGPPPAPVSDTWEPSGDPAGGQLASAAPGAGAPEDSAAVAAALRVVDQVKREAVEAPVRAARAHANLVPATVLNLLA